MKLNFHDMVASYMSNTTALVLSSVYACTGSTVNQEHKPPCILDVTNSLALIDKISGLLGLDRQCPMIIIMEVTVTILWNQNERWP